MGYNLYIFLSRSSSRERSNKKTSKTYDKKGKKSTQQKDVSPKPSSKSTAKDKGEL